MQRIMTDKRNVSGQTAGSDQAPGFIGSALSKESSRSGWKTELARRMRLFLLSNSGLS
jgi:hypothetical protein